MSGRRACTIVALTLAAALPAAAQTTFAGAQKGTAPEKVALEGFRIVLVEGDLEPGKATHLPLDAATAIGEMKAFLPFQSYRVVDTAWIQAMPGLAVSKLRGADGTDLDLSLDLGLQPNGNPRIGFRLRESAVPASTTMTEDQRNLALLQSMHALLYEKYQVELKAVEAERERDPSKSAATGTLSFLRSQMLEAERRTAELTQRIEAKQRDGRGAQLDGIHRQVKAAGMRVRELEAEQATMSERYLPAHPSVLQLKGRLDEARVNLRRLLDEAQALGLGPLPTRAETKTLIDTIFSMRAGETIVVGTSRTAGSRALVAVVTAVTVTPVKPRFF